MKGILSLFLDIAGFIIDLIKNIFSWIINTFLEINLFEKAIVISCFPALMAVVLPIAQFTIFDEIHDINNPLSVYLIGIILIMIITVMLPGLITVLIRCLLNGYYLFWVIFMAATDGISKAHYEPTFEISFGYYLNIVVPIIFIFFSLLSFFSDR